MTNSNRDACRSGNSLVDERHQDLCDLLSRGRIDFGCGRAVGHETASVYEKTERMHRRQLGRTFS
jgi:hypothetical protein